MVTKDRTRLAARALRCLAAQTWSNIELVVIDDGDADYAPLLDPLRDRMAVEHVRLPSGSGLTLGRLRNLALDAARGEVIAQWDDDEWYHPERLATQVAQLREGVVGCVLKWTLMHVDTPELTRLPYRADAGGGTPGTIVHRRTRVRYPDLRRSEDARFLDSLRREGDVVVLGREASHLFIRCFHGANTWDARHFHRRLRRTPFAALHWLLAVAGGDLRRHPQLCLGERERASVDAFLADSRSLDLIGVA
jgi:glycosyltransferase involved in cell wall biosynthesis